MLSKIPIYFLRKNYFQFFSIFFSKKNFGHSIWESVTTLYYCTRTSNDLDLFIRISNGVCADYNYLPILTETTCNQAAAYLKVSDTESETLSSTVRPIGCYFKASHSAGNRLWLNSNTRNQLYAADGERDPLCITGKVLLLKKFIFNKQNM